NRCPPGDFGRRTAFAIQFSAALDFFHLPCALLVDVAVRNIQARCQIPVDKDFVAGAVGDRAESELWLPGDPDLPDEHDIEGCIERFGYLEADRDTASRQRQDDRLPAFQMQELVGKPAAGLAAIRELHVPTSQNQRRTSLERRTSGLLSPFLLVAEKQGVGAQ